MRTANTPFPEYDSAAMRAILESRQSAWLGESVDSAAVRDFALSDFEQWADSEKRNFAYWLNRYAARAAHIIPADDSNGPIDDNAFSQMYLLLSYFRPEQSAKFPGQIALTKSLADKERERRTAMKPGKALRFMFPFLPETAIAAFVDSFREEFPVAELTLHTGESREDFRIAYAGKLAPYENPRTTYLRKSLANSCMRFEFDNLPGHPAESYASGDFRIAYVKDKESRIAGRVVIRVDCEPPACAPVYGCSEQAIAALETYLESIGAEHDESWHGARMLSRRHGGGWILPYLDCEPRALSDHGQFLIIDQDGDIEGGETSGIAYESESWQCEGCGCRLDEYDGHAFRDSLYCESCYEERVGICDHCQDAEAWDDLSAVFTNTRFGTDELQFCDHCLRHHAVECSNGEYWTEDSVTYIDSEDTYVTEDELSENYFLCDESGEYVSNEYRAELENGDTVDSRILEDDWQLEGDGKWHKVQARFPDMELPEQQMPIPARCRNPVLGRPMEIAVVEMCHEWRAIVDAIARDDMFTLAYYQKIYIAELRS